MCCAHCGRLSSETATPPIISMGRKMHCPSACTAGTVSASAAITRPSPINAKATNENAIHKSNECAGSVIPTASATPSCSKPALNTIR